MTKYVKSSTGLSSHQSNTQQFSLKAKIQRKVAKLEKVNMVGQFWPGNILTNSPKLINEALKRRKSTMFVNRDPSQPMEVVLSFDF